MRSINARRPILTIENKEGSLVLQAVVLLFTVHVLQAVDATVVDYPLLVPEALGEGRVLLVHVFYQELALFRAIWVRKGYAQ